MIRSLAVCCLFAAGLTAGAPARLLRPCPAPSTRADSLRGGLRPGRTCYLVHATIMHMYMDPRARGAGCH